MVTKFEWYKTTLDFLKGNKVLLVIVTALLGGNIYQAFSIPKPAPKVIIQNPSCVCIDKHIKEHH